MIDNKKAFYFLALFLVIVEVLQAFSTPTLSISQMLIKIAIIVATVFILVEMQESILQLENDQNEEL
jgi:NADH:ubiquinone oxidoreductase subunit 3 (subunit A)